MNTRRRFLKGALVSTGSLAIFPALANNYPSINLERFQRQLHVQDSEADFWKTVRMQFPLKSGQTYFNNGTMGPQPSFVIDKVIEDMRYSSVHAAETDYKSAGPDLLTGYFEFKELRTKLGAIINADYKTIALTQNATMGMNFIANGMEFNAGDEIINTDQEHGGGFAAWQQLAKRRGMVYKQAKLPIPANDTQALIDAIWKEVTPKTKVIAIPHIVSVYGTILPIKEICIEARKKGILTVIDGAQTVGQIKVDTADLGCDVYYGSLHKWLFAPAGNGFLYINPTIVDKVWCTLASYNWENTEDHGFRLQQYGTGNPSLLVGLDAAIDFYNTIGAEKWLTRVTYLGNYLREGLMKMPHVEIHSSVNPDLCAGITTYAVEGITGPELQKMLWDKEKLQPRSVGTELLRHSTHIYNSPEEIDRALRVIRDLGKNFDTLETAAAFCAS